MKQYIAKVLYMYISFDPAIPFWEICLKERITAAFKKNIHEFCLKWEKYGSSLEYPHNGFD